MSEPFDNCNDFPVRHINSKDIPVWGEELLPQSASVLMFVTEQDQECGKYLPFAYKLPASFLAPASGNRSNMTTLAGNGATIIVPDGQVRAGYVYNNTPNDIRLADTDDGTKPMFLILGKNKTDESMYDVIVDGIYKFDAGHEYVVGYTYYLGLLGQPTTENTGQPLFDVLDKTKIRVHLS